MPKIRVALVQFDAVPERVEHNLEKIRYWAEKAANAHARWIMFHEGTVCDYTPNLSDYAEPVPDGRSTQFMADLAKDISSHICFGLSERENDRYYISQVFVGPRHFVYRYRKTWLSRDPEDKGYRNEWARYDPGTGPELFTIDGIRATCFICADGEAPRCIDRATGLHPQVVFYPNNRGTLPESAVFGERAKRIDAPMLVTNRTGRSWLYDCQGGSAIYASDGQVLAEANREGREELLLYDLKV